MLIIKVPSSLNIWDEKRQEFFSIKEQTLQLEHSLISVSKWESKWHKSFFTKQDKTIEETTDYIKCMCLNSNVKPEVFSSLSKENYIEIKRYIEDPMTATVVPRMQHGIGGEKTITSELIYYWMITCGIPFECEKWHIARLLKLIEVCNFKNSPPKKMSQGDIMRHNKALNDARKAQMHTRG